MGEYKRPVVSVVGAGNVGEHVANLIAIKEIANVRMFDLARKEGDKVYEVVKGKALDIKQMAAAIDCDVEVEGFTVTPEGEGYESLEGSDIVVVTAGFPRRPGMSRDDLLSKNVGIIRTISERIAKYAPESIVIVVSNPVDVLTYAAYRITGFPKERVMGMAGVLDTARFKAFLSMELKVSVKNINAYVLGSHGDDMVPLLSVSNVGGEPLTKLISEERLKEIVERTKFGGGEIVSLMGTSAYHAPGASVVEMVDAILRDKKEILPCSVFLEGEAAEHYHVEDVCIGIPVKLGAHGVEEVIKLDFTEEEKKLWESSVRSVKSGIERIKELGLI
ncbi:malate dehydrogenase (NAD) [Persephonella hydrogeniphila]|uniref:Malate dehydrogenase n=1 Tax=Persephonella hydrogeniphila TaxID=198703 RepID=A0A285NEZ1_9AQUI|nr:malate dehydrogenase [Persephonella hydrogeniphila]SNZ08072.1 malate dehydrogenase (NAD) [Persephonella hydrogeniphila]